MLIQWVRFAQLFEDHWKNTSLIQKIKDFQDHRIFFFKFFQGSLKTYIVFFSLFQRWIVSQKSTLILHTIIIYEFFV